MINTVILKNQNDEYSKTFVTTSDAPLVKKRKYNLAQRRNMNGQVMARTLTPDAFKITKGRVDLYHTNQIFCMEHIQGNVDIVLPKVNKVMDWVVLWYDQDRVIDNVSHETHSRLKVYGNGTRIMGYDEPLICDLPFMSLRFTFTNITDGWIIT